MVLSSDHKCIASSSVPCGANNKAISIHIKLITGSFDLNCTAELKNAKRVPNNAEASPRPEDDRPPREHRQEQDVTFPAGLPGGVSCRRGGKTLVEGIPLMCDVRPRPSPKDLIPCDVGTIREHP